MSGPCNRSGGPRLVTVLDGSRQDRTVFVEGFVEQAVIRWQGSEGLEEVLANHADGRGNRLRQGPVELLGLGAPSRLAEEAESSPERHPL
jgi:hypothetical protein